MNKRGKIFTVWTLIICLAFGTVFIAETDVSAMTRKQKFTKRYQKLVKKCKKKFKYDGPQQTMNLEASKEYKLWDKELNYQYHEIYIHLSASAKAKLKKKQIKWIKKKEKKAKVDASDWTGGSGYPMIYYGSLTGSTKKRIRWLIKNYA